MVKTDHGIDVYKESWEQLTRDKAFEGYVPEEVCISLCQIDGILCHPTVKEGDYVFKGQVIGEPDDEKYACIHASISGRVEEIFQYQRSPGIFETFVCIKKENGKQREWYPFSVEYDKDTILKMMYRIGIHKEDITSGKILIVNGFANEPYITSGYRLIMESSGKIVIGAILWSIAAETEEIYLCVNEDALDAVSKLKRAVQKYGKNLGNRRPIWIIPMKRKYPKGNEQIIRAVVAGKKKNMTKVVSIAEMTALYDGIYDGEPWTRVGVTLSGKVMYPKNLWIPIGTNVNEMIEYCGGMPKDAMVICGGPFKGKTVDASNYWIRRETTGILVLESKDIVESSCVKCGMCREYCPKKLCPDIIEKAYLKGTENIRDLHADQCIGCGICSYVCPSGRRLTEYVGQVKKGHVCKKVDENSMKGSYIDLNSKIRNMKKLGSLDLKSQSAPHIHRRGTIQDVMRNSIYGLIPLIAGVFIRNPESQWHILSMLIISSIAAYLTEYFWQQYQGKYMTVHDGSAIFTGILLALLFSAETSLWKVAFASVISILLGKQWFGGIGCAPIHPVIVGKLLFQPFGVPVIEPLWYFAVFALGWLILTRMIPWSYPAVYLIIVSVFQPKLIFSASVYIAAAYFVWSYETLTPTRFGKWTFTLLLAVLTIIFFKIGMGSSCVCFAVAFADLFRHLFCFPRMKRV